MMLKDLNLGKMKWNNQIKKMKLQDAGVATAFVGAIAILLLVACYVISRLAGDHAHREKWKDYNDCGWA